MIYVQQSLGPDEQILAGARFHWMYTVKAVFWIVFGIALGSAVGYAAVYWDISQQIRAEYPNLPSHLFPQAWDDVVAKRGGMMRVIWGLSPILRGGILVFFAVGLFLFAHLMIVRATTEIAITTSRMIYKKGLVARHVGELDIDRIEGVSVRQGVLGRLFGYGEVIVRGMGVGEVTLPPIEDPISFRKVIQEAKVMEERGKPSPLREDF